MSAASAGSGREKFSVLNGSFLPLLVPAARPLTRRRRLETGPGLRSRPAAAALQFITGEKSLSHKLFFFFFFNQNTPSVSPKQPRPPTLLQRVASAKLATALR